VISVPDVSFEIDIAPPGAQGTYETQPRLIAERREDGRRSQQR
jgi:hypothetical protein